MPGSGDGSVGAGGGILADWSREGPPLFMCVKLGPAPQTLQTPPSQGLTLLLCTGACKENSVDTCPAGLRWGNSLPLESPHTGGALHSKHRDCR